jgi:hypothetical protein
MSWIDELETVLNNSTKEEFEKMWAKYNDFDFGPELDCFVGSSLQYYYGMSIENYQTLEYQNDKDEYSGKNNDYALAA